MQEVTQAPPRAEALDTGPVSGPLASAVGEERDTGLGRRHVVGTIAVEVLAAVVLLPGSAALPDGAMAAVAAAMGAVLFVVRAGLGAALAGRAGAAAWGTLAALQLAVLAPGLADPADARVVAGLTGLGAIPLAAGLVPAAAMRGLFAGRREDVTPGLLAVAVAGGLGVLAAVGLAGAAVDDARVTALAPYVAAGMAVLALAEVLAHHRAGAGFPETVAAVGGAAVAVQVLVLIDTRDAPLDTAVTALVVAGGIAAVGLLVATVLSTPRPLALPAEEADGGPRVVGWALAALVAAAALARLGTGRPLWLDEAATAEATRGSLRETLDAARTADAHPPLAEGLAWVGREILGSSDLALRAPSLAAGVALVPVVYLAAARLYDRRTGLVAAALAAVGPGLLWLSQSARPGMVAALLATLALFTMLRAVQRGRPLDWVLFAVVQAVLVWSHQLAFLHAGLLLAFAGAVVWQERHDRSEDRAPSVAGWAAALLITTAAFAALVAYRGGVGPPTVLPPLEYATRGAPGAGRSVLGLAGTAVAGVVGFHPQDVTSRLLALWPLGILATFALTVRRWSGEGLLLLSLAATPFVALLVLQVAGAPRSPLFALEWTATALPMVAIGLGRAASLAGPWPRARLVAAVAVAVLAVAALDQAARVHPVDRLDVTPAVEEVAAAAREGDLVVYAPASVGDLVRHEVRGADVVSLPRAGERVGGAGGRIIIVGAMGLADDGTRERTVALVEDLAAHRPLASEVRHGDTTIWSFA